MKLLVINATGKKWKSLPQKLEAIKLAWNGAKNAPELEFGATDKKLVPLIKDGRVTAEWFNAVSSPAKDAGFGAVLVIFPRSLSKKLKDGIRGSHLRDDDGIGEMWVVADEKDKLVLKNKSKVNRFEKVAIHELSHMVAFTLGAEDKTHDWDYVRSNIAGAFTEYNWKKVELTKDLLPLVKRKRDEFVALCTKNGVPIRVTEGFRSSERQEELYAQGRTKPGPIITKARGGQSLHNYGVAFDICFQSSTPYEGDWAKVGKLGKSIGLEWGGEWVSFVDKPHFQIMLDYSLKDFQDGKVALARYS